MENSKEEEKEAVIVKKEKRYLTPEEAEKRKSAIGTIRYTLGVLLTKETMFYGSVVIEVELKQTSKDLFIDFSTGEVKKLSFNAATADPKAHYKASRIIWPIESQVMGWNKIHVLYQCPYDKAGNGISHTQNYAKRHFIHTQFEPFMANRAFPCFDQPDLKARFTLVVLAPADWAVISNEHPETLSMVGQGSWDIYMKKLDIGPEVIPAGSADQLMMTIFPPTKTELCTYVFSFVAGDYAKLEGEHVKDQPSTDIYVTTDMVSIVAKDIPELIKLTRLGIRFYEEYLQEKYPFTKYDQCFIPNFKEIAMENAGCVNLSEDLLAPYGRMHMLYLMMHEMAHHWFGDLVTLKWWSHLWLNEGFATFFGRFLQERIPEINHYGEPDSTIRNIKSRLYECKHDHPLIHSVTDTKKLDRIFDTIAYDKGAAMVRQLMSTIGEDKFKEVLRHYIANCKGKSVVTADLISSIAAKGGDKINAEEWGKQWIERAGENILEADFTIKDGVIERFWVKQLPYSAYTCRTHYVNILIVKKDGVTCEEITDFKINAEAETEVCQLKGKEEILAAYPNSRDRTYAQVKFNPASKAFFEKNLTKLTLDTSTYFLIKSCSAKE